MSKEIEEFIEYLKKEVKKTLPFNAKNGDNNIFKVQRYEHEKYNCELSQMLSEDKAAIDTFKEVYSKKYFELKHPFKNDIITRAVYTNIFEQLGFYGIFFIDKDNKFPWILYWLDNQFIIICNEGIFSHWQLLYNWCNGVFSNGCIWRIQKFINDIIAELMREDITYKDIAFCISMEHY